MQAAHGSDFAREGMIVLHKFGQTEPSIGQAFLVPTFRKKSAVIPKARRCNAQDILQGRGLDHVIIQFWAWWFVCNHR